MPRRFWASLCTIGFDELAATKGQETRASFMISPDYLGNARDDFSWPVGLIPETSNRLLALDADRRSTVALRSHLYQEMIHGKSFYSANAGIQVSIYSHQERELLDEYWAKHHLEEAAIVGQLSAAGPELSGKKYPAIFHRFESLQLNQAKPGFGEWFEVNCERELGSDSDVISIPVLLGLVEILEL